MVYPLIRVPGKTFLLGEYAVLSGGPALLVTTPPCFTLQVGTVSNVADVIAPASPTGKLIADNREFFAKEKLFFMDPYQGAGGFGASGAQFALVARYLGYDNPWQVWKDYRRYAMQEGHTPSGADIIAQWSGGLVYFSAYQRHLEKLTWPFAEFLIALIHTGRKTATHLHLQSVSRTDFALLFDIVHAGYAALKNTNAMQLLQAINHYGQQLKELQLVTEHTQNLLAVLATNPDVLAAKGCGALGADVVLAVIPADRKQKFIHWTQQKHLRLIYCDYQLAEGISI